MKLFTKIARCAIFVDEESNFKVQRFADKHCVNGRPVNVVSYGDLLVVAFDTEETYDDIFEQLKKEFGQYFKVTRKEVVMSVSKR